MKTEQIISRKPVATPTGERVVITTLSGAEIWVAKNQIDQTAETISYNQHKAGTEWVNVKTGAKGIRKSDANEFVGYGKTSKFDVLDYLKTQGVTPVFSL